MRFGSRKLLVTAAGLALGGALAFYGHLDSSAATLIGGIVTAYLTSNVSQKALVKT